jgi:iron complex outermembrane receptor protein
MIKRRFRSAGARRPVSCWSRYSFGVYVLLALSFQLTGRCAMAEDALDRQINLNIPANTRLEDALIEWGAKAEVTVMINTPTVDRETTRGIRGTVSARSALADILRGSGLSYTEEGGRIRIVPVTTLVRSAQQVEQPESASVSPSSDAQTKATNEDVAQKKADAPNDTRPKDLEEIVVTAEKREERLSDVPMSLTALTGEQLERSQSYRFQDYVGSVPGLAYVSDVFGPAGSQLVIRGITTGAIPVHSSVATYIDETPYNVQSDCCSYLAAPNLDTFDMQRIEVLKGPQGTLYGASAMAGLFKFVTNAPDPSAFASKVEIGGSSVSNGGTGFDAHAMVNLPLSPNTALRLVGYDNYYPGFIDDPSRGLTDINGSHFTGGRASLLYEPTADLSIRFNALHQDRTFGDSSTLDVYPNTLTPVFGYLTQERSTSQPGHTQNELYNITIHWDAGIAKLVSTTSYLTFKQDFIVDYSEILGAAISSDIGAPYGAAFPDRRSVNVLTQEVRLSAPSDNSLQWQLGGFFTRERTSERESLDPVDLTTHQVLYNFPTNIGTFPTDETYQESAAFASVDYYLMPTVDIDAGARYSTDRETFYADSTGLFGDGPIGYPLSASVATYSGDARWHITPETMLYARVATGFVPGGATGVAPDRGAPLTYSPSTTVNYETGIKSRLLDNHFTIELSAFDVEWRDIQVYGVSATTGLSFNENAGTARSDGVEWQFAYIPISGLTLEFNGAYTDARLTQATPSNVGGKAGDRLPAVPLWETSASAKYERSLFGNLSGFGGVDWRFSGSHYGDFEPTGPRPLAPSFNIVDLRAGVETKMWSAAFYVKNVGNEIPIYYLRNNTLEQGGLGVQSASIGTPRTIGVELTANF